MTTPRAGGSGTSFADPPGWVLRGFHVCAWNWNLATAVALARVLAGASVVSALTAAHALAFVFASAVVFGNRCAAAMTLAGILTGAGVVAAFAAALTTTVIPACADMIGAFGVSAEYKWSSLLCSSKNSADRSDEQLIKISSL